MQKNKKIIILLTILATILVCILPMGLSPVWNGEDPGHRNQYEILADSILNGHVSVKDGEASQELIDMENPYDPHARAQLGVSYLWDYAFYSLRLCLLIVYIVLEKLMIPKL